MRNRIKRLARIGGWLVIGAAGVVGGVAAPDAGLSEVGERTAAMAMTADSSDRPLQVSADCGEWLNTGLVVTAGRSLGFPLARFAFDRARGVYSLRERMFFRLGPGSAHVPLASGVPDPAGTSLGETGVAGGARGYVFGPGGTGRRYSTYQDPDYADSHFDMHWSVVDAQPGTVTLRLTYPDAYVDHLHLRFLADGTIAGFLTWDEGPGGVADNDAFGLVAAAAPAPVAGAPDSLAATGWKISMVGGATFPVAFGTPPVATGPNLRSGAAGAWSYVYVRTGSNTGTLSVTDAAGNFIRFFLSFFPNGTKADFYAESATVQDPFGSGTVFGSLGPE